MSRAALREALAHPGPVADRRGRQSDTNWRCRRVITAEMAKGFTLYMVRAVLNGRLDELIDLALANVRR